VYRFSFQIRRRALALPITPTPPISAGRVTIPTVQPRYSVRQKLTAIIKGMIEREAHGQ
jgi:hypothetical protein